MAGSALLVDLDGTIWHSAGWYPKLIADATGSDPTEVAEALTQRPVARVLTSLGVTRARFARLSHELAATLMVFDGVAGALQRLSEQGVRIGAVTNLPAWVASPMLSGTGLGPLFHTVVGWERTRRHKPRPDPLYAALGDLGVPTSDGSWYVGDTTGDAEAAAAAGMSFAWAGYSTHQPPPDTAKVNLLAFADVEELFGVTLKFLYKIHSGYDGFRPAAIPDRLQDQQLLRLGWTRYLDTVELGAEVWIYFHGPHRFDNGVYVKGIVRNIDREAASVLLRVREYSTTAPLTDDATTQRVAAVVAPRYRQVFLFPTELEPVPACDVATAASTCRQRLCGVCPIWKALPLIQTSDVAVPQRLTQLIPQVVSAYWVIPARCYLHGEYKPIQAGVRRTSELFYRFKVGEENLAFSFALAMFAALRDRGLLELDFDAVVPIPLSPDKAERGEIHRTRLLARELGRLLGVRTVELLQLNRPLSKRTLGLGQLAFESRYRNALEVSQAVHRYHRLLLVDDVVTHGSTLLAAASRLRKVDPTLELAAVTAGQMILKASVVNEARIVA